LVWVKVWLALHDSNVQQLAPKSDVLPIKLRAS
jgi:hypothetical protein